MIWVIQYLSQFFDNLILTIYKIRVIQYIILVYKSTFKWGIIWYEMKCYEMQAMQYKYQVTMMHFSPMIHICRYNQIEIHGDHTWTMYPPELFFFIIYFHILVGIIFLWLCIFFSSQIIFLRLFISFSYQNYFSSAFLFFFLARTIYL